MIRGVRRGQPGRVVVRAAVVQGRRRRGAARRRTTRPRRAGRRHRRRRCRGPRGRCGCAGRARARPAPRGGRPGPKPSVSPASSTRLSTTTSAGVGLHEGVAELRHHQVRDHRREPRPRAEHDPVGRVARRPAPPGTAPGRAGPARSRRSRRRWSRPRPGRAPSPGRSGRPASRPRTSRGDVERGERHRQHPARRAEQPADPVEGGDRVAELLPEPDDQQVADDVAVHLAVRRRSGAGAPAPRCRPTGRRRTAPPAPSAGRPAGARRTRRAADRTSRRCRRR